MTDVLLSELAQAAGLNIEWTDAFGKPQSVTPQIQKTILGELGYAADSEDQIRQTLKELKQSGDGVRKPLIPHDQNAPLSLAGRFDPGTAFKITQEDGQVREGRLDDLSSLPGLSTCGYHQLELGDERITLAIAPLACPSVSDLTGRPDARIWGITSQLYSLRRQGDGGLGDTGALEILAANIAAKGADALAISRCMRCSPRTAPITAPTPPPAGCFSISCTVRLTGFSARQPSSMQ